ncbi:hypothetical protein AYL99_10880 [Fonsecaea erecta]|uniref:DUF7605 domain-containing protein n=1 Tax=Fonsecaea erecta TaxID=1367422 RepID=A0A178Z5Y1_9EURO|nr:hypothetical protein AYL99_10880 [Fonsecaea erecta]OAP55180.1 hypothetical protein AYL99_10880 [Fonsecaea erecta]
MSPPPDEASSGGSTAVTHTQLEYPPYREPSYEVAVVQSTNIAKMIVSILERSPRDPQSRLLAEAKRYAEYQMPHERLIGFIGNSGAGKSSTLNSLFDQDGLARTGACGSAVTAFATEFRFRQPGQGAPFTLDSTLMVGHELGQYMGDLLSDFRRASSFDKTESEESNEKIYENGKAASDTFEAILGGMDNFDKERLNCEDLGDAKSYLRELCSELQFPDNMNREGRWVEESQDVDGCEDYQALLQDRGLWPLVKSLSIFADIAMLRHGLTSVDLPGFNDTNLARIRAARKAQSKCDDTCIIAEMSRVCDVPIVPQQLELLRAKAEAQKSTTPAIIICTKSAADLERNRTVQKLVNPLKLEFAKIQVRKARKGDETAKKSAAAGMQALFITARNEKVTKDLQKKYGTYVKGGVKVFCVDNPMYWDATTDEERELSGIPALRQYLADLPAESLFKATDLFLAKKIPALVSSYGNWVDSCRIDLELEDRPQLPEARKLRQCLGTLRDWATKMFGVFEECFDTPLRESSELISAACLKVSQDWEKWPSGSVNLCFRNDGISTGGIMGSRNWNNELGLIFNELVMGQSWHHFEVATDSLLNEFGNIIAFFEVYAKQCSDLQAPANFQNSLTARLDVLKSTFETEKKRYLSVVGKIRFHANGGHQDSYIMDCMLDTYQDARRVSGSGSVRKRLTILQSRVGSGQFVDAFRTHLFDEFRGAVDNVLGKLKIALEREIEAVESDLEAIQPSIENQKLFKVDPDYGEVCEFVLTKVIKQLEEVDDLAETARAMARERYG